MLRPFQDDRAVPIEDIIEADVFSITRAFQPVTIQVKEALFVFFADMLVNQVESGTGERCFRAPAFADARREHRLACAHITW